MSVNKIRRERVNELFKIAKKVARFEEKAAPIPRRVKVQPVRRSREPLQPAGRARQPSQTQTGVQ